MQCSAQPTDLTCGDRISVQGRRQDHANATRGACPHCHHTFDEHELVMAWGEKAYKDSLEMAPSSGLPIITARADWKSCDCCELGTIDIPPVSDGDRSVGRGNPVQRSGDPAPICQAHSRVTNEPEQAPDGRAPRGGSLGEATRQQSCSRARRSKNVARASPHCAAGSTTWTSHWARRCTMSMRL